MATLAPKYSFNADLLAVYSRLGIPRPQTPPQEQGESKRPSGQRT